MDGLVFGLLAGAVIVFIVYKAVQMNKKASKSNGGSGGGGGIPQEDQNEIK